MLSHLRKLIDTRPPGNPSTEDFLRKLEGKETADVYREAMGEEGRPSTTDVQKQELTSEELARLQAVKDRERGRELVELRKREYLEWAQEWNLGGDDPEQWLAKTFTFNPDETVEVDGELSLFSRGLTRLPKGLTRVNGNLRLSNNHLTSLEGLPQEIHGNLDLSSNELKSLKGLPNEIHGDLDLWRNELTSLEGFPSEIHGMLNLGYNELTSLEGLRGKKIGGNLYLPDNPATSIPEGIELGGQVFVSPYQTALKADAIAKGYRAHDAKEPKRSP